MDTLLFIDDRPCSKLRPCSFNETMLQREDVTPILIRFANQNHCSWYNDKTRGKYIYTINNIDNIKKETQLFKVWCHERSLEPKYFCCMSEPKQVFGQLFATELNLQCLTKESVYALRHKPTMKKWIQASGLKTASFKIVKTKQEIKSFAIQFGYPVIIKPTTGWGTLETSLLQADEEIEKFNISKSIFEEFMVENYISDREYECCALIQKGQVLDVYPSYMPVSPLKAANGELNANISYGYLKNSFPVDLKAIVQKLAAQFDLIKGYLHMEFFMNEKSHDVTISELAFRYPGCEIAKNHGLSLGFDMANTTLDVYLEREISLNYNSGYCVGDLLLPYKSGKVKKISTNQELLNLPGVIESHIGVRPGDILSGEPKSSFNCSGWVFVNGISIEDVEQKMFSILNQFEFQTE